MSKELKIKRYSDSAPEEHKSKIRRIIAASDHKAFCTARLGDGADGSLYIEARRQDDNLWSLWKISTEPAALYGAGDGEDDQPENVKKLESGLCFFDALYYCASSELSWQQNHMEAMTEGENPDSGSTLHFTEMMKAEKIPLDRRSGLPVPVANGEILGEGVFFRKEREAAQAVTDNLAAEDAARALVKRDDRLPLKDSSGALPLSLAEDKMLARLDDIRARKGSLAKVEKAYNKQDQNLNKLSDSFALVRRRKGKSTATNLKNGEEYFKVGGFCGGTALAALGLTVTGLPLALAAFAFVAGAAFATTSSVVTLVGWSFNEKSPAELARDSLLLPHRRFKKDMKKMRRQFDNLPSDSPQRSAGHWLADQFELAYTALSARYAFQNAAQNDSFVNRAKLSRSLKRLSKLYEDGARPQEELDYMLAEIQEDPNDSGFERKIAENLNNKIREYREVVNAYKQAEIQQVKALPPARPR